MSNEPKKLYGVMAEFDSVEQLRDACKKATAEGYKEVDAYSPYPVEDLHELLGNRRTWLPVIIFCGGLIGAITGFGFQSWVNIVDYPLNVGGRPDFSWISFIPVTFECTVLFAAFSAVFGMLILNGLPKPYHPVFNVERFALASSSRFFFCIKKKDPKFAYDKAKSFLQALKPFGVYDVPR